MRLRQMEPIEVKVGEYKFYITPFPAMKAANISGELGNFLTPLFNLLGAAFSIEGNISDADISEVGAKVGAALSGTNISGEQIESLIRKLMLGGHIAVELEDDNGGKDIERLDIDILNEIFCGEIQDMYVLCYHVIKLNFKGFFKKAAALFGPVRSEVMKKMTSTDTGHSTVINL